MSPKFWLIIEPLDPERPKQIKEFTTKEELNEHLSSLSEKYPCTLRVLSGFTLVERTYSGE